MVAWTECEPRGIWNTNDNNNDDNSRFNSILPEGPGPLDCKAVAPEEYGRVFPS